MDCLLAIGLSLKKLTHANPTFETKGALVGASADERGIAFGVAPKALAAGAVMMATVAKEESIAGLGTRAR